MITVPLYNHGPNHYFGQYPMSQNQLAAPMLAMAIDYENPDFVIEIGTQQGGLICALAELDVRGSRYVSFDIQDQRPSYVVEAFEKLAIDFRLEDCFKGGVEAIFKDRPRSKIMLLCDGGNKMKEYEAFRGLLKPNDIIMAHDWLYMVHSKPEGDGSMYWNWTEFDYKLEDRLHDLMQLNFEYPWYAKQLAKAAWFCQTRKQ